MRKKYMTTMDKTAGRWQLRGNLIQIFDRVVTISFADYIIGIIISKRRPRSHWMDASQNFLLVFLFYSITSSYLHVGKLNRDVRNNGLKNATSLFACVSPLFLFCWTSLPIHQFISSQRLVGKLVLKTVGNIDLLYLKLLTTHFYAFASFLKVKLGAHLSFADSGAIEATTKQSFNETCVS